MLTSTCAQWHAAVPRAGAAGGLAVGVAGGRRLVVRRNGGRVGVTWVREGRAQRGGVRLPHIPLCGLVTQNLGLRVSNVWETTIQLPPLEDSSQSSCHFTCHLHSNIINRPGHGLELES